MYKIGVFSKMNKITVKTLRHYDDIGLLKPCHVDETTGYRYYSSDQLLVLHRILALKQIGFSLSEIIEVMDKDFSPGRMIDYLEGKKSAISKTIEDEQAKLNQVESYLKNLKQEVVFMMHNVILKELPEVIVASMRKIIPNYEAFNTIYPEMGKYMVEQKVKCTTPGYCFTLYHDGEYKESNIDVEICEAVTGFGNDSDIIKFKKIDGVKTAACVIHQGPYSTLGMGYGAIMKWIEENSYDITGLPRESYIDGIWNKENPDEWLTEIQIPVKLK
ncbi:MAG: MerR family transcriptional regulator [Syntrophomonadaceae bacterium]|nr:MerR family transcriptional regulator [Syntrophomonadaceae bacterium]MDD3022796.1 MerR family transcriptional regulator [Syntrophomonadaceae bacterium]